MSEQIVPVRTATVVIGLQIALFVTLGLPDGALGVAWASMRGSFERPLGDLGMVLVLNTVGYLAGSTSAATAARRVGTPVTMTASTAVAAAAMTLWVATGSWTVLLVAALVLGVSRGTIDAGLNAYVALHGGVRRLGVLHGSYGIGTSLGPLLVLASLATGTWRPAWIVIGGLDLVIAVLGWRWRRLWPPDVTVEAPTDGERRRPPALRAGRARHDAVLRRPRRRRVLDRHVVVHAAHRRPRDGRHAGRAVGGVVLGRPHRCPLRPRRRGRPLRPRRAAARELPAGPHRGVRAVVEPRRPRRARPPGWPASASASCSPRWWR